MPGLESVAACLSFCDGARLSRKSSSPQDVNPTRNPALQSKTCRHRAIDHQPPSHKHRPTLRICAGRRFWWGSAFSARILRIVVPTFFSQLRAGLRRFQVFEFVLKPHLLFPEVSDIGPLHHWQCLRQSSTFAFVERGAQQG